MSLFRFSILFWKWVDWGNAKMAKRLEFRSVVVDWSCIADVNFFKKKCNKFWNPHLDFGYLVYNCKGRLGKYSSKSIINSRTTNLNLSEVLFQKAVLINLHNSTEKTWIEALLLVKWKAQAWHLARLMIPLQCLPSCEKLLYKSSMNSCSFCLTCAITSRMMKKIFKDNNNN